MNTEILSFNNQNIIITGGAGVIAKNLTTGFIQQGASVSLWGRNNQTLLEAKDYILGLCQGCLGSAYPGQVHIVEVDCTSKTELQAAFAKTLKELGEPSVLLNCVGSNSSKYSFLEQDELEFRKTLELNLLAGLLLPSQVTIPYWIEHSIKGAIVNFTSMSSYMCFSGVWAYESAKVAVLHLTKGMAREFAEHGIRVNSVSPGFFLGKANRRLLVNEDNTLTARGQQVISRTPMGRFGEADELQGAVLFLSSNRAASFVTGIDIPVDGGFLTDSI